MPSTLITFSEPAEARLTRIDSDDKVKTSCRINATDFDLMDKKAYHSSHSAVEIPVA